MAKQGPNLRLILGDQARLKSREMLPAPFLETGIPRGAIIEVLGASAAHWCLEFLRVHSRFRALWCERDRTICPRTIERLGVRLDRMKFVYGGNLRVPIARAMLSDSFQVVLAPAGCSDAAALDELRLLTEKANSVLFLINDGRRAPSQDWPITMQLQIRRRSEEADFSVRVVKQTYAHH